MSETADEKFAAVESEIEKEYSAAKAALREDAARAREKAASALK
ncbi:MAG: hypothetical protein ABSG45_02415 [Nitrososphaerales archaeon]|jgi:hypothetical protein